jgi:hypothetical protein
MTLPGRMPLPRLGALAILVAMIAVVWGVIIGPLWSAWNRRAEQADHAAELIVRLKISAMETASIQQQLATLGRAQRDQSTVMVAANANLAGAALQSEVKRIVDASGAQLRSVQQIPPVEDNAVNRIGVRVDLQSDSAQIEHVLFDLDVHRPIFLVKHLLVRGQEQQQAVPNQRPQLLDVQLEVSALTGLAE